MPSSKRAARETEVNKRRSRSRIKTEDVCSLVNLKRRAACARTLFRKAAAETETMRPASYRESGTAAALQRNGFGDEIVEGVGTILDVTMRSARNSRPKIAA